MVLLVSKVQIPFLLCIKNKKVKADLALHGNPVSEIRDVTFHNGSHSVTCHPTQVNAPRPTPAMQAGTRYEHYEVLVRITAK